MATISDVAKLAGVSNATVSRVLNKKDRVSKNTREAVLRAVRALDYQPTATARNLRTQETRNIGLIIPDISNSFYAGIAKGAQREAHRWGYCILLVDYNYDEQEAVRSFDVLRSKRVDGLLALFECVISDTQVKVLESYRRSGDKFVIFGDVAAEEIASIGVDDYQGAYDAVSHLVSIGHTNIVFVGGEHIRRGIMRIKAFKDVMIQHGLPIENHLILRGESSQRGGYEVVKQVLSSPDRPTAVFAENDQVAFGVYVAADELGLSIPDDLAVVGFDNDVLSTVVRPRLTTVAQPRDELGALGVDLLLRLMRGEIIENRKIVLGSRLVVRESTIPIKRRYPS